MEEYLNRELQAIDEALAERQKRIDDSPKNADQIIIDRDKFIEVAKLAAEKALADLKVATELAEQSKVDLTARRQLVVAEIEKMNQAKQ